MACAHTYSDGAACKILATTFSHEGAEWCAFHYRGPDHVQTRLGLLRQLIKNPQTDLDLRGFRVPGDLSFERTALTQGRSFAVSLEDAQIEGNLNLAGAQPSDLNARNLRVSGNLVLDGVRITGRVDLQGVVVLGQLQVRNAHAGALSAAGIKVTGPCEIVTEWRGTADFSGDAVFESAASFHQSSGHPASIDLSGAQLRGAVRLGGHFAHIKCDRTTFGETVVIKCDQLSSTSLNGAQVANSLNMEQTIGDLNSDADTRFGDLSLSGAANRITIAGVARSIKARPAASDLELHGTCEGEADFTGANVTRRVHGQDYRAVRGISLRGATLAGASITFDGAHLLGYADLSGTSSPPIGAVSFRGAVLENARFDGREFGRTDLTDCVFRGDAPSFAHCKLHPSTHFPTLDHFEDVRSVDAAKRYQTLREHCGEIGAHLDEGMFNVLQQRSLRHTGRLPVSEWAISWLYDKTSV